MYPGYTPPGYILPVHPWVYHYQLVHPAHARRYPVVSIVRDDDALGSTLGIIREKGRYEAHRALPSPLRSDSSLRRVTLLFRVNK